MKRLPLIILSFFALISWQNCGTPETPTYDCTSDNTIPFPEDALNRFYFKTGTYWIYQELNNPSVEDSIWVSIHRKITAPANSKVFGKLQTKKCYDNYINLTNSTVYGEVNVYLQIKGPFDGFDFDNEFFEIIEQPIGTQGVNRLLLDGNTYRSKNDNRGTISIIDSLITLTKTYHQVLHFQHFQGDSDFLKEAWYVKNIGPVKLKRADGSEWELVRYLVNQ